MYIYIVTAIGMICRRAVIKQRDIKNTYTYTIYTKNSIKNTHTHIYIYIYICIYVYTHVASDIGYISQQYWFNLAKIGQHFAI